MEPIEFQCPNFGPITVVGDQLHESYQFVVRSNGGSDALDYLIFLDSRGISRRYDGSLADKLVTQISRRGRRYLLLCRPLELTTWATLVNFITLNNLNPAKILTNMGFVDFTPKKRSILEDAIRQVDYFIGKGVAESRYVENHVSAAGAEIPLYSMIYGGAYRQCIEAIAIRQATVIINTPLVDPGIRIERERPQAFFSCLRDSNEFNRAIRDAKVVDIPDFDETLTYDAVHYTDRGNEVIFDRVREYL